MYLHVLSVLISVLTLFADPCLASQDSRAYWLWAGVTDVPSGAGREIHLVWRPTTLLEPKHLSDLIVMRIRRWESHNIAIEGVQLDFDAATQGLGHYHKFLGLIRAQLPAKYKLSATRPGRHA